MKARICNLAIDIRRDQIRAIEVEPHGEGLRIRTVLAEDVPDHLAEGDADAIGAWMGDKLRRAGFSMNRTCFAVAREHVSLKRLTLPTTDPFELPDMVRLSMQRDLPFDPAEAVIDFVPVASDEGHTTVLVAAMRSSMVDQIKRTAKAAGLQVDRISLRCMGAGALLRTIRADAADDSAAWLGVDITANAVELTVLAEGSVRFSRAAAVMHLEEVSRFADALITETRRSWMSYRIVEDAPEISGALLMGDRRVTQRIVNAIGELMNVETALLTDHPRIDTRGRDLETAWPLAGLLLEPAIGCESFDFAQPRRAADRHARTRQLVLAGVGAALLLITGVCAMAWKDLRGLDAQRSRLESQVQSGRNDFYRTERDQKRLQHLEQWDHATADWLSHLVRLQRDLPDPSRIVLDEWSGSLRFSGAQYDRTAAPEQRWRAPAEIVITLDGEAVSQTVIDDFRRSFAESSEYRVSTSGPDTQGGRRYLYPFKLTLRTNRLAPTEAEAVPEEGDAAQSIDGSAEEQDGAATHAVKTGESS